jgi:hypothetical protein
MFVGLLQCLLVAFTKSTSCSLLQVFEQTPDLAIWTRFQRIYAPSVRKLVMDLKLERDRSLLEDIVKTRPRSFGPAFFPKLRQMTIVDSEVLRLTGCRKLVTLFMNHTVQSLAFKCRQQIENVDSDDYPSELPFFFNKFIAVGARMPHLTSLTISDAFSIDLDIANKLYSLFRRLPELTELELPAFKDYTKVLTCLARHCTRLKSLTCLQTELLAAEPIVPMPSLKRLMLGYVGVCELDKFFTQHPVKALEICGMSFEADHTEPQGLAKLFTALSSSRRIMKINLDILGADSDFQIGFDRLQPLLQCNKLRDIICQQVIVSMTDADLCSLGRSLPCLESLRLSPHKPEPQPDNIDLPTLRGLVNFAHYARKLRILQLRFSPVYRPAGLRLGATRQGHQDELTLDRLSERFKSLTQLSVGQSRIDRQWSQVVAVVFGQILPLGCTVEYISATLIDEADDMEPEDYHALEISDAEWDKIIFGLELRAITNGGKVALPV